MKDSKSIENQKEIDLENGKNDEKNNKKNENNDFDVDDTSKLLDNPLETGIDYNEIMTFDEVLSKIKFGKFQYKTYFIIGLLIFSEGTQISTFTLMIPILKHEWKIDDVMNGVQASLLFISILIGSLVAGQISDRYGRKRPTLYSVFFMFIFSFLTSFSPEIFTLIILRIFLGFLIGFFAPIGATIVTEITPSAMRGTNMAILIINLSLGQLFGLGIGYFVLENLSHGNWRALILWNTVPSFFAWLLIYLYLEESPRYELIFGKYQHSFDLIEKMYKENYGDNAETKCLNESDKKKLINWTKSIEKIEKVNCNALFEGDLKKITPMLWFNWFSNSFCYYGILIFLPYILDQSGQSLPFPDTKEKFKKSNEYNDIVKLVISNISEIFSVICAGIITEIKGFGRKNSMIIFFSLSFFFLLMAAFDADNNFILWATISKFFLAMTFVFIFLFTSEIYPTMIRTTGIGVANAVGRVGGIVMPWVCVYLSKVQKFAPFYAFSASALLSAVLSAFFPFDTCKRELDKIE